MLELDAVGVFVHPQAGCAPGFVLCPLQACAASQSAVPYCFCACSSQAALLPRRTAFCFAFTGSVFVGTRPRFGGSKFFKSLSGITHTGPRKVSSERACGNLPCRHHRLTVDLPTPSRSATCVVVNSFAMSQHLSAPAKYKQQNAK